MIESHKLRGFVFREAVVTKVGNVLARHLHASRAETQLAEFWNYVHAGSAFLESRDEVQAHHATLRNFRDKFDRSFDRWKSHLEFLGGIPSYPDVLLDLLHLGMWDAAYANDPSGALTPFGPWLAQLGDLLDHKPLSVFHALVQQLSHPHLENLSKAQSLAVEMYRHFLDFAEDNRLDNLKPDRDDPPIVQLYAGGGVTWFSGLPVPTLMAFNQAKAHDFSGFSALPHEFGHDLSGTFNQGQLAGEIRAQVASLGLEHTTYWETWVEEALADAVGVAVIGEGEIYSLANLFTGSFTNVIFTDESGTRPDEHPNRHIRVLLTIEVGRLLGLDSDLLDVARSRWVEFGKTQNTMFPHDEIYDQFHNVRYPVEDFLEGLRPVAAALVETPYLQLEGQKVRDIFAEFSSPLAAELKSAIDGRRWT